MIINQIPLPQYLCLHNAKPREVNLPDTVYYLRFGDLKSYILLALPATIMEVPISKTDVDGSMMQDVYYKHNDLPRMVEYCQCDAIVVANVLLRFNDMLLL